MIDSTVCSGPSFERSGPTAFAKSCGFTASTTIGAPAAALATVFSVATP